mmetsp:Transcript_25816/g.76261  ORF Transcript_25816/g.76261 Transcript_25816/m.76261 type:complete len:309 (-) Transcript_25816:1256-2182(-)
MARASFRSFSLDGLRPYESMNSVHVPHLSSTSLHVRRVGSVVSERKLAARGSCIPSIASMFRSRCSASWTAALKSSAPIFCGCCCCCCGGGVSGFLTKNWLDAAVVGPVESFGLKGSFAAGLGPPAKGFGGNFGASDATSFPPSFMAFPNFFFVSSNSALRSSSAAYLSSSSLLASASCRAVSVSSAVKRFSDPSLSSISALLVSNSLLATVNSAFNPFSARTAPSIPFLIFSILMFTSISSSLSLSSTLDRLSELFICSNSPRTSASSTLSVFSFTNAPSMPFRVVSNLRFTSISSSLNLSSILDRR